MPEQVLKGNEAKEWILAEGRDHWWIYNHFRKIRLFINGGASPSWHLVYNTPEPRGGLGGGWINKNWDHKDDHMDVVFVPSAVKEITLSTSRHTYEDMPEMGECDVFMRIVLPSFCVELNHVYYKKSFGRTGYSEHMAVWHGYEIKPIK